MLSDIKLVIRLQDLDNRVAELTKEVAALPKHIAEIEKKLEAHERKLEADRAALSANQKDRKHFEGEGSRPTHMVHVEDAAALLARIVVRKAAGIFNAAGPEPLSIGQWADAIAEELGVRRVRRLRLPLAPVEGLSAASGYRLLAAEQLLLLRYGQVLDARESLELGWRPRWSNAQIVRATARSLLSGA